MSVVTAIRKDGDPRDPMRDALREAIRRVAEAQSKADRQLEAIRRAQNMVRDAEAKVSEATSVLTAAQEKHAEDLVRAATTGVGPKTNGQMRAARAALGDAEDGAAAARDALARLQGDGEDLEQANPQLLNSVLVEISRTIAPAAERLLFQFQRRLIELEILKGAFLALTDDIDPVDILFNRDVERLNAKDWRQAPVKELRDRFFSLDSNAIHLHAQETVASWQRWRAALRSDPDAPAPELPA